MKKKKTTKSLQREEVFYVHATPGAKRERVARDGNTFLVSVKEKAERNLANKRIRDIVASELDVPPARVRLLKGHRSPKKIFSIAR
jgi:uncharacterized protein YggU (UPF0235/DUF167 family)